ncbi:MAG: hypothetical protein KDB53_21160 [Planctomycetes bacterium]|nr:hypothetical protein [Planctomycetota bacterium]
MKSIHSVLAVLLLATIATAQFDSDGPNATLRVQGVSAAATDPVLHDVPVQIPGTLSLRVGSGNNVNQGISLLASVANPTTGNVIPVPWGGSIDLGTPAIGLPTDIVVIGDGIGLSTNLLWDLFFATGTAVVDPGFKFDAQVDLAFNGTQIAFQAVVKDPTRPPFNIDNTQVASTHFAIGQTSVALTGNDGTANLGFSGNFGFNFHGQNHTDVWISANGFVTFGAASSLVNNGFSRDAMAAVSAEPAIFAAMADWAPDGFSTNDGVVLEQIGSDCRIEWGDPAMTSMGGLPHAGGLDLNNFAIRLTLDDGSGLASQGTFRIDMNTLDPTAVTDRGNGIIGHTPGSFASGAMDTSLRVGSHFGAGNAAQLEEHDADGTAASHVGWDALGTLRGYNDFTSTWNNASLTFTPNAVSAGTVAGTTGYTSSVQGPLPADALVGMDAATIDVTGGLLVTLTGSFFNFDPNGSGAATVVFDSTGVLGGPFPGIVAGILDSSFTAGPFSVANPQPSPHRDGQALQVMVPPMMTPGNSDLQVINAAGQVFTLPVTYSQNGAMLQSFTLPDDGFMTVPLTVPITFYGQVRSSLILNSNGYITFNQGSTSFTESMALFFDGALTGIDNPIVALWYSDMNLNGVSSGATFDVLEDSINSRVTVSYNNQNHWASTMPAGNMQAIFDQAVNGPGSVVIDLTGFIPGPMIGSDDGIVGVSDGDVSVSALGTDTDFTNGLGTGTSLMQGLYVSPGNNDSIGEQMPAAVAPGLIGGVVLYLDLTGSGQFLIL